MEPQEEKDREERAGEENNSHEEHKKKKKKDELIEELKRSLEEKEEASKALQEKMLYLQAEFENFKRLKNKEKQDILKFGNETLIKELLPVLDNLDRALDHASNTGDFKSIHEGVKIIANEFLKVLERAGIERVEALGKKFDPNFHEAFLQEEKEDIEPDMVVTEMQKGYLLNGRLIRPSMVAISKKPEIQ
jgi:molecular chaperone GrpE